MCVRSFISSKEKVFKLNIPKWKGRFLIFGRALSQNSFITNYMTLSSWAEVLTSGNLKKWLICRTNCLFKWIISELDLSEKLSSKRKPPRGVVFSQKAPRDKIWYIRKSDGEIERGWGSARLSPERWTEIRRGIRWYFLTWLLGMQKSGNSFNKWPISNFQRVNHYEGVFLLTSPQVVFFWWGGGGRLKGYL